MKRLLLHTLMPLTMVAATLAGCAGPGRPLQAAGITVGQTTKKEILARLGEPDRRFTTGWLKMVAGPEEQILSTPHEVWIYYPGLLNILDLWDQRMLRIVFETDGIVTSCTD